MPRPELQTDRCGAIDGVRPTPPDADNVALEHCRVWLKWAAAQVEECLTRDSLASGDLLRSLAEVLGPEQPKSGAAPAPALNAPGGALSAVVIAVQSHDRVMQGLAHVAESLHALHAQLGDARHANSCESWRVLRETQFRAFSMAQERSLFARMVAHADGIEQEAEIGPDDTIELFSSGHGRIEP